MNSAANTAGSTIVDAAAAIVTSVGSNEIDRMEAEAAGSDAFADGVKDYVVAPAVDVLELYGRNEVAKLEFHMSLGPALHNCAVDLACSSAVAVGIHLAGVPFIASPIPQLRVIGLAIQVTGFAWDAYVLAATYNPPTTTQAVPYCGYHGEAC